MFESLNSLSVVLLGIACVALCIQLFYYVFVFSKFAFYKQATEPNNIQLPPVSVIIAARNEYANLEKNLRAILEQDYPNYEVIVINDCSWDESQKLLEYYQEVYSHLKICKLVEQEKYPTGKKFALTIGIKAAQYDKMVFTDADCEPKSNQWLRLMQSKFENGKEIVIGFSPYKKYSGLLNLFIRFEGVFTAIAYFSAALLKRPFMGVGRNLAYTKDIFFQHKGFASHQHILSGDDDLFVNEASTATNVAIQVEPKSFVLTEPKKSFSSWQQQKSRHVSTGKYYKPKDKVFLGTYYASLFLFYAALILMFILLIDWRLILGFYSIRLLVQFIVIYSAAKRLKSTNVVWFIPILDLLFVLYMAVFGTKGLFTKNKKVW